MPNERTADTPRTNACVAEYWLQERYGAVADLARTLERELAEARKESADRLATIQYLFKRLEEILPCDDDNRPIEAHARKVVARYNAIVRENAEFDDAEHKATTHASDLALALRSMLDGKPARNLDELLSRNSQVPESDRCPDCKAKLGHFPSCPRCSVHNQGTQP